MTDVVLSGIGLVVLAPLLILIALAVRVDSRGPVFFRQERVGRFGKRFRIHKFRTMSDGAERAGREITVGADPRITAVGRWLRRYKLDELPQLLDVICGDMSLVGPRPEVPRYVELYPDGVRQVVLSVRPGITDNASIEYRDESELLARSVDPDATYINEVLPAKLAYGVQYVRDQTWSGDIVILWRTLLAVVPMGHRGK